MGPIIHVDKRLSRLLVIGTDEQISQVGHLLVLLDLAEPGAEIRLAVYKVEHVLAEDMLEDLRELVRALLEDEEDVEGQQPARSTRRTAADRRRVVTARDRDRTGQGVRRGDNEPLLLVDSRTNRLLAVGNDQQLSLLEEMLALLDVVPYEYEPISIEVYQPQFVEAAEVLDILDKLQITKQGGRVSPRDRARQGVDRQGRSVVPSQQEGPTPAQRLMEGQEGAALPGAEEFEVLVAVQESMNKLFVLATKRQHEQIADIVTHIDMEPDESQGAIQVYDLSYREPEAVAGMLQELLDAEREAKEGDKTVTIPGREDAAKVVALDEIFAIGVHGTTRQHDEIRKLLTILDRPQPQVLVEAILVQVSADDALRIGVSLKGL